MAVDVKNAFDLSGRVALITGASSWGIGSALVLSLWNTATTSNQNFSLPLTFPSGRLASRPFFYVGL